MFEKIIKQQRMREFVANDNSQVNVRIVGGHDNRRAPGKHRRKTGDRVVMGEFLKLVMRCRKDDECFRTTGRNDETGNLEGGGPKLLQ